jgi:hypothetical protein
MDKEPIIGLETRNKSASIQVVVGGHPLVLSTTQDAIGTLTEIQITLGKEGEGLKAVVDAFSRAVSIGLQNGIDLNTYVEEFLFSRFEPSGQVFGHDKIRYSSSILDFVFRELAISFLDRSDLAHTITEAISDIAPRHDENGAQYATISRSFQEQIRVSTAFLVDVIEKYIADAQSRKPNDMESLTKFEEGLSFLQSLREDLIDLLHVVNQAIGSSDTQSTQLISRKTNAINSRFREFVEKHSDVVDSSARMSLAAMFTSIFSMAGANMTLTTPLILALFGGGKVISLLKQFNSKDNDS